MILDAFFQKDRKMFSSKNALWLCDGARLAYEKKQDIWKEIKREWKPLKEFEFIESQGEGGDTQLFCTGHDEFLIVAFRGTEKNLQDVITDVKIFLTPGPKGKIHTGFASALDGVWGKFLSYLKKKLNGRSLWLTGHSLGGALAHLATARLIFEGSIIPNGLYTFGEPRVGDSEFIKEFDSVFASQYFRFVHHNDTVPRIPTREMGYTEGGTLRFYDANFEYQPGINWAEILINRYFQNDSDFLLVDQFNDHGIKNYMKCVESGVGEY